MPARILPPGGPMEIVFSFDTTGSMGSCINEVKGHVQNMVQRLQADIPGIKIAIIAHGDYCDKHIYVTKHIDFTDDIPKLCNFVKNVKMTTGGDSDECYELVLYEVHKRLSWNAASQKALVMIGDSNPHEPNYPQNKLKLDWRKEADTLGKQGIKIYSVQCQSYGADNFYKTIADKTGGQHLKLSEFQNIFDFIMAVCYRERGDDFLKNYESEVRGRTPGKGIHKDLDKLFGTLRDVSDDVTMTPVKTPVIKTATPKVTTATVKTLKGAKRDRAADWTRLRRGKKTLRKYGKKVLPRHNREDISERYFLLNDLKWSRWECCLTSNPDLDNPEWIERRGDGEGYKRECICNGKTKVSAIYEFSVQLVKGGKRYVVLSKLSNGFVRPMEWESKLVGKKVIKTQINEILKKSCDIFVRRAVLKSDSKKEKVRSSVELYDYAWEILRSERKSPRSVSISGIAISDSKFGL